MYCDNCDCDIAVCSSGSSYSYKKFELMLTTRAKAYSSSCSQVILVYLHPFCRNSLSCSQKITLNQYF